MPAITGGTVVTRRTISCRAARVPYAVPNADPTANMSPEMRPVMMMKASRESRSVLP